MYHFWTFLDKNSKNCLVLYLCTGPRARISARGPVRAAKMACGPAGRGLRARPVPTSSAVHLSIIFSLSSPSFHFPEKASSSSSSSFLRSLHLLDAASNSFFHLICVHMRRKEKKEKEKEILLPLLSLQRHILFPSPSQVSSYLPTYTVHTQSIPRKKRRERKILLFPISQLSIRVVQ